MADDDPGLTPEQEQRVRRLLTDARHTEPMPGDVAARLDRVLAELARGEEVAPVVPLASRRRRRAATMLVAAAAVVVGGIGLGQVLGSTGGDGSSSTADRAAPAEAGAAGAAGAGADGGAANHRAAPPPSGAQASKPMYALPGPVRVRSQHFSRDVRQVQARLSSTAGTLDYNSPRHPAFSCKPGHWGTGLFVPASYRGEPTVLVFRQVRGDTQVVDLFQCDSDEALRSVTLPAP